MTSYYPIPPLKDFVVLQQPVQHPSGEWVGEFRAIHIRANMGYVKPETGTLMFRNYSGKSRATYLVSEFAPGTWRWYGLESSIQIAAGA